MSATGTGDNRAAPGSPRMAAWLLCALLAPHAVASAETPAGETPAAVIAVPLKISLDKLRQQLEADESLRSVSLDQPKRRCYKGRIISISCRVLGRVERSGAITLSGSGNRVDISMPIHAEVAVKTTSGIRSSATVTGDAVVALSIAIDVRADWQPSLDVTVDYHWTKAPTVQLLNRIDISLRSYVDPYLQKEIAKLQDKVAELSAEIEIESDARRAWRDLQRTRVIDGDQPLYFNFNPTAISFAGVTVERGFIHTALSVSGSPQLKTRAPVERAEAPLPALTRSKAKASGFAIGTDIHLAYDALARELLRGERVFDVGDGALLQVDDFRFSGVAGKLVLTTGVIYDARPGWLRYIDVFDWFVQEGAFELQTQPSIDNETRALRLSEASVQLLWGDLETSLFSGAIVARIEKALQGGVSHGYGKALDDAIARVNADFAARGKVGSFDFSGRLSTARLSAIEAGDAGLDLHLLLRGDLSLSM